MNKIESNPIKTILIIVTGLLIIYFFSKLIILLNIILVLCLIGVFSPFLSKKIEILWFKIAYILSLIIPNIVLGMIFYLVLFPISLLSRISSNDPLFLKNKSRTIYKEVNKIFSKDYFKNTW
tara:strand:+ start:3530 stop:3895 length:366 start_codon:yes stop_codon:yes gene_type:complete